MTQELEKMSKQQLLDQVKLLQARMGDVSNVGGNLDDISHELQVHQIELEMQNRELREAQQELEETRDRYADLYDFAPVTYITFDDKGIIRNINLTGSTMLGKPRALLLERPFSSWLVKSDLSRFFRHLRDVLQSDIHKSIELKLKNASGLIYDVRIDSVRSSEISNGTFSCRSIILDITENNRYRDEVTLQARQLKLITDALPVSIAYIDMNEQHTFANKTYTDWFELAPEDIAGKTADEVWRDAGYSHANKYLKISLSGKQTSFDMEMPLVADEKKHIHTTLIPDVDADNHVCGVIVLMGDITDKLATEIIDRKRLLESAHLSRLSTMGEMASEVAHELNQPLAAISIYSDACRRMILSGHHQQDKIIQSLTDIGAQAERAGEVIRRIREFTSKKELKFCETSVNEITQEALRLLSVELRSHKVRLNLELADSLPMVVADKILIEQVILNLGRNALEAMEEINVSQRQLHIQTSISRQKEIEVCIHDSGPGLSGEMLKQVFEPFHTTKVDGMGMGLTICQTIIEAHHGRLWATLNEHGGTTFCFTLPVVIEGENYAV